MNDHQRSSRRTHPDEDKPILVVRVFRVIEEARVRIAEGALSFFKPDSMLSPIAPIFLLIPLEAERF